MITALFAGVLSAKHADQENAAVFVAEKRLALVDEGNYADSWKEVSETYLFISTIPVAS